MLFKKVFINCMLTSQEICLQIKIWKQSISVNFILTQNVIVWKMLFRKMNTEFKIDV